jgi:hypothetical protein
MRRIISVLAVMAIVAAMAVAMAMPAFAGNAKGLYDTNEGRYVNDYNESNSQKGYENGSDAYHSHGNGDYRN